MNTKHGICLMFTCRKGTQAPEGYFGTLMEEYFWRSRAMMVLVPAAKRGERRKKGGENGPKMKNSWKRLLRAEWRGNPKQATFLKHHLRANKPNNMIDLHLNNINSSPTLKTCDGEHQCSFYLVRDLSLYMKKNQMLYNLE